jgi:predicted double-glycine peptidase
VGTIGSYRHQVAAHCETGSTRNVFAHAGLALSEPMVFGLGSGPAFFYLFFTKTEQRFPFLALRNEPGKVLENTVLLLGVDCFRHRFRTAREAMEAANRLIDEGTPVVACVDMFYMRYLPKFLHVHAPFHFVVLVGRDGDTYFVSDPYHEELGELKAEDLEIAWDTRAPFSKGNLLAYVRKAPASYDLKRIAVTAIKRTCRGMVLPPVVRKAFFFVGVEGMRTLARKIPRWSREYRGVVLREGVMLTAVGFEDQGTGGGAFRLMYGAFLQDLGAALGSPRIEELAAQMIAHGQTWRSLSGDFIALGRRVPLVEADFDDFWAANGTAFEAGLRDLGARFAALADFEEGFFGRLKDAVADLS